MDLRMNIIFLSLLVEEWVKLYILKADSNLAIGAVWANHCDSSKRVVLGGLNELKDFIVS